MRTTGEDGTESSRLEGEPEKPPESADDRCWVCGAAVTERHCKIVCPRCGFMRDCSDP